MPEDEEVSLQETSMHGPRSGVVRSQIPGVELSSKRLHHWI